MPAGQVSITFMSGPLDGRNLQWSYPAEGTDLALTIGRREGCDIILNYDTQVSRVHARVICTSGPRAFFLEDVGSRNGTFVGNNRIEDRVSLKPGTLFRVGRTWLRLDLPSAPLDDTDRDTTHF